MFKFRRDSPFTLPWRLFECRVNKVAANCLSNEGFFVDKTILFVQSYKSPCLRRMVAQRPIDNGVAEDAMWPHGMARPRVKARQGPGTRFRAQKSGIKGREI
ncbi:hypothetical protein EAS61_20195 [Bradyrhizobium zhanjiangense]|uniref:Uncharacterized protein n=1 Tax=Bradyrhizobium zhanjiangense TaxID=1325107 RepID=A0A4Q0QK72_9BRAD|nr:hypothetical protein EAS61_20195 [Bradyrhizobium zhanjiangense]